MKKRITQMMTVLSFFLLIALVSTNAYASDIDGSTEVESTTEETTDVETVEEAMTQRSMTSKAKQLPPDDGTEKILNGVYIDSVNVSNMTKEQAMTAVDNHLNEISGYNIKMYAGNKVADATAAELGLSWDGDGVLNKVLSIGRSGDLIGRFKVKEDLKKGTIRLVLPYEADRAKIEEIITERCLPFDGEPVNATMKKVDGEFVIENGQPGIMIDLKASVDVIEEYISKLWRNGGGEVELAAEITPSPHDQEGLKEIANILGSATTDYSSSSANRAKNIKTGTEKINGAVLFPGEEYSVCDALVPFSKENGYELGGTYADGEVVDDFGGGICQVSTTLYLALLRSELEIVERFNHSMTVKYVKLSMDAAIAEGAKDLIFKNNLEYPIFIEGYTNGGEVGFSVYGKEYRPEGREVRYENETLETTEAKASLVAKGNFGKIEQVGAPYTGYVASLWKVVTENGQETRTKVNDSNYQMVPAKYEVGVDGATGEAAKALYSAIEKNDIEAAFSALYKYG